MDLMKRFFVYYAAFEQTYVDDDWSRLEGLFAPDAVYRVTGSGAYDCELRGREAVLAGIRKFLDGFDRRCTRRLESIDTPSVDGNTVSFRGAAIYTRGDSPELRLVLTEAIEYRDGLISRITDTYDESWREGPPAEVRDWLRDYGSDLELNYE
jgi:hypothetical protein